MSPVALFFDECQKNEIYFLSKIWAKYSQINWKCGAVSKIVYKIFDKNKINLSDQPYLSFSELKLETYIYFGLMDWLTKEMLQLKLKFFLYKPLYQTIMLKTVNKIFLEYHVLMDLQTLCCGTIKMTRLDHVLPGLRL